MKPSSLQEAVVTIRETFPETELQDWATQPEDTACLQAHWGLGLWIRNHWIYDKGSPLASEIKKQSLFLHDDDISSIILKALWRVLNGDPCPTIQELLLQ